MCCRASTIFARCVFHVMLCDTILSHAYVSRPHTVEPSLSLHTASIYLQACIDEWLAVNCTCPTCRTNILTADQSGSSVAAAEGGHDVEMVDLSQDHTQLV